jgi:hypothetical protein
VYARNKLTAIGVEHAIHRAVVAAVALVLATENPTVWNCAFKG